MDRLTTNKIFFSVYGKSLSANITPINNTAIYLNWEFAEDIPHYGSFQGYQVLYKASSVTGDYILSTEIDGNITQALVHLTLVECEFYSFKVRAFSLEGYGKLSEAVTVETFCGGKKYKLNSLWLVLTLSNAISRICSSVSRFKQEKIFPDS